MLRNQRKLQVLQFISDNGGQATSNQLEIELDMEIHNARMALLRYFNQGLLRRSRGHSIKLYTLTEKGYQRLQYLKRLVHRKKGRQW